MPPVDEAETVAEDVDDSTLLEKVIYSSISDKVKPSTTMDDEIRIEHSVTDKEVCSYVWFPFPAKTFCITERAEMRQDLNV